MHFEKILLKVGKRKKIFEHLEIKTIIIKI